MKPDAPPEANTLYFGQFPPGPAYAKPKDVQQPVVLDWDIAHPMMQYIRDLTLVFIAQGPDRRAARRGQEPDRQQPGARWPSWSPAKGSPTRSSPSRSWTGTTPNTTWFRYISFPLFILNSIQTLGNVREGAGEEVAEPGNPVALHAETINREITVASADRPEERVPRSPQGTFIYNHAEKAGLYLARWDPEGRLPFAVNLFDFRESDLAPRGLVPEGAPASTEESYKIKIGYNPVTGTQKPPRVQKDIWWWFALLVLGVLLVEWYIYNRRVYI